MTGRATLLSKIILTSDSQVQNSDFWTHLLSSSDSETRAQGVSWTVMLSYICPSQHKHIHVRRRMNVEV